MTGIQCNKCKEVVDVELKNPHDWKKIVIELADKGWSACDILAICPACRKS